MERTKAEVLAAAMREASGDVDAALAACGGAEQFTANQMIAAAHIAAGVDPVEAHLRVAFDAETDAEAYKMLLQAADAARWKQD